MADVFDTMLSMKASLVPQADLPQYEERVTGAVGFAGPTVTGAVYLHQSAPFAKVMAATMLGLSVADITGETEVNDVVGEATNMLTGGLKSWLCDCGYDCAVSTPAIIRGASYVIEPPPEVEREWLIFECGSERVIVEVHIKLN
jgi:chemotaxis protein CheX